MFEVWLIIFFIFLGIEIVTVDLVTIWFALGAIAAAITSLFISSLWVQLPIFFGISIISIILMRPLKKKLDQKQTPTNLDRVIGMTGIVTEDIQEDMVGEVKVDGKLWSAISKEDKLIQKGQKIEVLAIKSTKLQVRKVKGVK